MIIHYHLSSPFPLRNEQTPTFCILGETLEGLLRTFDNLRG